VYQFGAPQQILTGFASWLHCCSDVAHRRPTKLSTIFGRLLGWYTIYTFLEDFCPWRNFATCKIHFASKSCVLLYCQRYCTALQQRASANVCGVVQRMELGNFRRRRAPPIFGWATITLGIGPHSSFKPVSSFTSSISANTVHKQKHGRESSETHRYYNLVTSHASPRRTWKRMTLFSCSSYFPYILFYWILIFFPAIIVT